MACCSFHLPETQGFFEKHYIFEKHNVFFKNRYIFEILKNPSFRSRPSFIKPSLPARPRTRARAHEYTTRNQNYPSYALTLFSWQWKSKIPWFYRFSTILRRRNPQNHQYSLGNTFYSDLVFEEFSVSRYKRPFTIGTHPQRADSCRGPDFLPLVTSAKTAAGRFRWK